MNEPRQVLWNADEWTPDMWDNLQDSAERVARLVLEAKLDPSVLKNRAFRAKLRLALSVVAAFSPDLIEHNCLLSC